MIRIRNFRSIKKAYLEFFSNLIYVEDMVFGSSENEDEETGFCFSNKKRICHPSVYCREVLSEIYVAGLSNYIGKKGICSTRADGSYGSNMVYLRPLRFKKTELLATDCNINKANYLQKYLNMLEDYAGIKRSVVSKAYIMHPIYVDKKDEETTPFLYDEERDVDDFKVKSMERHELLHIEGDKIWMMSTPFITLYMLLIRGILSSNNIISCSPADLIEKLGRSSAETSIEFEAIEDGILYTLKKMYKVKANWRLKVARRINHIFESVRDNLAGIYSFCLINNYVEPVAFSVRSDYFRLLRQDMGKEYTDSILKKGK